jgi:hypothetical protein
MTASRPQHGAAGTHSAVPTLDIYQLATVYTVGNPLKAEIIQNALHDEGIRCFLEGENQAGETGLTALEIKIQVPVADADRARKFIRIHEHVTK